MKRPILDRLRIIAALGAMTGTSGCVALNLPSDRYQDPADHGGILGSWRPENAAPPSCDGAPIYDAAGAPIDNGALTVDPFDTTTGEFSDPKKDEIPWPRFHPIPTRPIFGNYR
jgi:hypothetical protein